MAAQPYAAELALALRAVHNASLLTKSVLRSLSNNVSAETKADDSPVTIADFAAQALLISTLHAAFPTDAFLGEESAGALRENDALAERVWELVQRAQDLAHASTSANGEQQQQQQQQQPALTFPTTKAQMLEAIDRGGSGETTHAGRVWVMDPVDGTATFMQGQQYAVCLCLLEAGTQRVGVIGCPNLAFDVSGPLGQRITEDAVDAHGFGVVVSAVAGQGTYVRRMLSDSLGAPRRVDLTSLPAKPTSSLDFVESTLGKTSLDQDAHAAVAATLGAPWPGTVIWAQQVKHVALALGATDVMVRIPRTKDRFTCVWDHAGGHLVFSEAGGVIRDFDGGDVDFAQGRLIKGERNYGMIAARPEHFDAVERAVRKVLRRDEA
jgi:3'(2'), 5'-bisphosphate nucleotidase